MKRRALVTAATLSMGAAALGVGQYVRLDNQDPGGPIIIRFSHVVAENTPKGKAALFLKSIVAERSSGRVLVEVYPNSELYKDKEELEAVQLGSIQMVAPSLAKLGPLGIKEFEIFDIPFLFSDYESVHTVTYGKTGARLLSKLRDVGLMGLTFWDNGFKQMSANRPLIRPADFQGLKMRIQASEVLEAQMRALGAIPDSMALSDVYPALQSGLVDGTENPVSNFFTQRMFEVQRFMTLSNHGYLGYVVIVNERFWTGLPSKVIALMNQAISDATRFANDIARSENEWALKQVRDMQSTQILQLEPAQRRVWMAKLAGVQADFRSRMGGQILDDVLRLNSTAYSGRIERSR